ncbi:MAG: hypothetical protein IPJ93_01655 [Bacteroidota bacterium]|nr:MAG: hypothetical protein IPJ93_01655 [Bacteroidota bacterium]
MKASRLVFILILSFAFQLNISAQYVPQSVFNKPLYDFMDDLANLHIITLNDAIKPYSRKQIAEALQTGEFWATLGKGLSIFGSYRDYTDSRAVADDKYLNDLPGYNYKYKGAVGSPKRGGSFDETRGGIAYAWKWGHVGIVKDNFEWGSNNHGANIISTKAPSFARLELKLNPKSGLSSTIFTDGFILKLRMILQLISQAIRLTTDKYIFQNILLPTCSP